MTQENKLGALDIQLDDVAMPTGDAKSAPTPPVGAKPEAKPEAPSKKSAIPQDLDALASSFENEGSQEPTPTPDAPTPPVEDSTTEPLKKTKEENFAAIRKSLKAKEEEIETLKKELSDKGGLELSAEETRAKLQELETKLTQVEQERDELSNYKAAIDITKTEAYKKEILNPIKEQENIILDTAKQYGLTEEQLKNGLNAKNFAELERSLSEDGMTPTGIMTIVNSVKALNNLRAKEREMSSNSKKWLEDLKRQDDESRQALLNEVSSTIQKSSKVMWDSTLNTFREDAIKGQFPYVQKTNDANWNKAIESADNAGARVYSEFLKDLESNVKNRTVTPSLIDKVSKLSFGYGHFLLSQQSQMALQKQNQELRNRIAILEGDSPGMGGSSGNSSTNGTKPSYAKSFEDIASEI